jgi:kynurenine formamidase
MYQLLSYPIEDHVPAWPGNPQLRREYRSRIARGDTANTALISLFNHTGTHFDAPNHFIPEGLQVSQLPLERFIFERPLLLDIPKGPGEKVRAADLAPHEEALARSDLLLIRTGFSRYRTGDPRRYEAEGPGIGSDCAEYLVSRFSGLGALAIDFVSVGSYADRDDGNLTHRILLGGRDGRFICPIEDVNLESLDPRRLKRVFALPLMVQGIDSAPVTMVAELESTTPPQGAEC